MDGSIGIVCGGKGGFVSEHMHTRACAPKSGERVPLVPSDVVVAGRRGCTGGLLQLEDAGCTEVWVGGKSSVDSCARLANSYSRLRPAPISQGTQSQRQNEGAHGGCDRWRVSAEEEVPVQINLHSAAHAHATSRAHNYCTAHVDCFTRIRSPCGLAAAKTALEEGLQPTLFEAQVSVSVKGVDSRGSEVCKPHAPGCTHAAPTHRLASVACGGSTRTMAFATRTCTPTPARKWPSFLTSHTHLK